MFLLKSYISLTIIILLFSTQMMAVETQIIIRGYVYDIEDNTPVSNANIMEPRSRIGVSTDANGFFSLQLPVNANQLRITHIAYKEKIIHISNIAPDSLLRIMLTKSDIQLEEVSVTSSRNNILNTTQMGTVFLSQKSIKQIPTVFGEADIIKVLQTQPGVSAGTEGLSGMYVRGGNEDENLYPLNKYSFKTAFAQIRNWGALLELTRYPTDNIASRL